MRAGRTRALIRRRTQRCSSGQYTRLYCRFTSWSFLFRLCENVTAGAGTASQLCPLHLASVETQALQESTPTHR